MFVSLVEDATSGLKPWDVLQLAITLPAVVLILFGVQAILRRDEAGAQGHRFRNQVLMIGLTLISIVAVILALPLDGENRRSLLGFFGLLLSAAIALASTTLLGNVMAGFMLSAVRNFRIGDFIRCGEYFGRVTERGVLHTEIQTEDRDLTTLPNLFLVSNPTTVLRSSGTIISARLSLGYDVPRTEIERALKAAALDAHLEEPIVRVLTLGDYSVTYRISGLLKDVNQILSVRSRLRAKAIDRLHEAGIEIVSPTIMNTRAYAPNVRFVTGVAEEDEEQSGSVESVAFDKADLAASLQEQRERLEGLEEERTQLAGQPESNPDELVHLERRIERLQAMIAAHESKLDDAQSG